MTPKLKENFFLEEYVCSFSRNPEKGYMLDGWKEDHRPENVDDCSIVQWISQIPQEIDAGKSFYMNYPEDNPRWMVWVEKKEENEDASRIEYSLTLHWFPLEIPPKKQHWISLILILLFCIFLSGMGIVGYYQYVCRKNVLVDILRWGPISKLLVENTPKETVIQLKKKWEAVFKEESPAEKRYNALEESRKSLINAWDKVQESFDIFGDDLVLDARQKSRQKFGDVDGIEFVHLVFDFNDKNNAELFEFTRKENKTGGEPKTFYGKEKVFTATQYDDICRFLREMKSFKNSQIQNHTSETERKK